MHRLTLRVLAALLLAAAVSLAVPLSHAAKKRTYVYVHDSDDNGQVFAYLLGKDGALTGLAGSPFTSDEPSTGCGGQCQTMAYSKKRKVLLTTNETGITSWLVGKDGALTEVAGSPFAAPEAIGVAVVETKKRVFVYAARNRGALTGFELRANGMLTLLAGTPFVVGTDLVGAVGTKKSLLLIDEGDRSVYSFAVGADGSLTEAPDSPFDFSPNGFAYSVHTDRKGKFAIVSAGDALEARRLNKKTAQVTPVAAGPLRGAVEGGNGPAVSKKGRISTIPFGQDVSADDLEVFSLNKKTGAFTSLGVHTLTMPDVSVYVWDLTGKVLICASRENDQVQTFDIDKKTGAPTLLDLAGMIGAGDVTDIEVVKR